MTTTDTFTHLTDGLLPTMILRVHVSIAVTTQLPESPDLVSASIQCAGTPAACLGQLQEALDAITRAEILAREMSMTSAMSVT